MHIEFTKLKRILEGLPEAQFNSEEHMLLYTKKLGCRLLFDKGVTEDHERSFLTKLKQQWGRSFTYMMEEMIKDSTVARDVQVNFEEYLKSNDNVNLGMDLTVTAITPVNWPTYKITDLNLPEEMVRSIEVFKEFYTAKSMNKKLTNSLGICHVSGKFESKTIELVVSTAQVIRLLLYWLVLKL